MTREIGSGENQVIPRFNRFAQVRESSERE